MPDPPIDPDDAPSAEDEDITVGQARARLRVIQALRETFPARRTERFEPFVNSLRGSEPERIEAILGPVEGWTTVVVEDLERDGPITDSALAFLSDDALCFYLPAFLIPGIMGQCWMGPPNFWLVHGFAAASREGIYDSGETREAYSRRRYAGLTRPQLRAVIGYLEWWVTLDGAEHEREIVEALDHHWRPRALARLGFLSRHA